MYDAFFKRLSAHELKHRFNDAESRRGSTLHDVQGRISVFSNKNLKKKRKKNTKAHSQP